MVNRQVLSATIDRDSDMDFNTLIQAKEHLRLIGLDLKIVPAQAELKIRLEEINGKD